MKGMSFAQQYIVNKGLKVFEKGTIAANKELDQLCKRNCFEPIDIKDMTRREGEKAQQSLMFLCQKRDGSIKGQMVYDGKPAKEWIQREDVMSPTE